MSRYQEKKGDSYKSKYVEKPGPPKRFDFVYDPEMINFKTEIPPLPEKHKPKPDEKKYTKEITELREKYEQLKEQRKKKKNEYKAGSKNYEEEVGELKKKIELGKKCLVVLNFDIQDINNNINLLEEKIQKKFRLVKKLQRGDRQTAKNDKTYEEMNLHELEQEQDRLRVRISTANLNKKEENELNSLIAKINRLKRNAQKGETPQNNDYEIEENKQAIERLKKIKNNYQVEKDEINRKIECIRDDIDDFEGSIDEFEQKKKNPQIAALADEAKQLKEEILKLREQIAQMEEKFTKEKYQYEYEQEKIKWIKWAKEEQQKFQKRWEEERIERARQKQRAKDSKEAAEPAKQGEAKQEKRVFNKYQKQIDACTFLIDYCQGLQPKPQKASGLQANKASNEKNQIEKALKKGQWAKEKGIQIIKSKKADDNEGQKAEKAIKKKKPVKREENEDNQQKQSLTHNVFVQNVFDTVKVVPPSSLEELQKIVAELQTKLDYFVEHPEGPISRPDKTEREKPKYTAEKYAKAKQNKKVINTEDFPSLS